MRGLKWRHTKEKAIKVEGRYRLFGSTHQSPTKDAISRAPHKRSRQDAKKIIKDTE